MVSSDSLFIFLQNLEELVCVEAVSREPPVGDQVKQKRSDEKDMERVERARGKILRKRALSEDVQHGELDRNLRARHHELEQARPRSSWATRAEKNREVTRFEGELKDVRNSADAVRRSLHDLQIRVNASLSKAAHLLPLRHRQLYFPSLTDN
jgi:hypothetical protein